MTTPTATPEAHAYIADDPAGGTLSLNITGRTARLIAETSDHHAAADLSRNNARTLGVDILRWTGSDSSQTTGEPFIIANGDRSLNPIEFRSVSGDPVRLDVLDGSATVIVARIGIALTDDDAIDLAVRLIAFAGTHAVTALAWRRLPGVHCAAAPSGGTYTAKPRGTARTSWDTFYTDRNNVTTQIGGTGRPGDGAAATLRTAKDRAQRHADAGAA